MSFTLLDIKVLRALPLGLHNWNLLHIHSIHKQKINNTTSTYHIQVLHRNC
eukprot:m.67662 g.67662  ORF g.67662 m.67662 type:complete len:51 (+) comp35466_c0_seq2:142-294(+)